MNKINFKFYFEKDLNGVAFHGESIILEDCLDAEESLLAHYRNFMANYEKKKNEIPIPS